MNALVLFTIQLHEEHCGFSSHNHWTCPVPTMFGGGFVSRQAKSFFFQAEVNLIDSNPRLGILFLKLANEKDGNLGVIRGLDRGSDKIYNDGTKDRRLQDEPWPNGQIFDRLKHQLLSFILQCI
jgi:hypothetical protein